MYVIIDVCVSVFIVHLWWRSRVWNNAYKQYGMSLIWYIRTCYRFAGAAKRADSSVSLVGSVAATFGGLFLIWSSREWRQTFIDMVWFQTQTVRYFWFLSRPAPTFLRICCCSMLSQLVTICLRVHQPRGLSCMLTRLTLASTRLLMLCVLCVVVGFLTQELSCRVLRFAHSMFIIFQLVYLFTRTLESTI